MIWIMRMRRRKDSNDNSTPWNPKSKIKKIIMKSLLKSRLMKLRIFVRSSKKPKKTKRNKKQDLLNFKMSLNRL